MTGINAPAKPAVIAISSHVARGTVGNRAIVFALETLGFPVWSVPTITLPWHPGHGPSTRIVPQEETFARFMEDLTNSPWLTEVGAVLTGYLGGESQATAIADLITEARKRNPGLLYVCDPVIGDDGGLYVPDETAVAIRDRLLPMADIATPNRFELQWLTGKQGDAVKLAKNLGPSTVLVTSAFDDGHTGNLLVTEDQSLTATHSAISRPPNGLGDLTASLYLAHRLSNRSPMTALSRTTSSVFELLQNSLARGADELTLESDSSSITQPTLQISAIDYQGS